MTKRACPFDTGISRQMKIHINDYDNNVKRLKEIQESTVKALFSCQYTSTSCSVEARIEKATIQPFAQKQVTNYFLNSKKTLNVIENKVPKVVTDPNLSCSYCDAKSDDIQECIQCMESFCKSCSFIVYGTSRDDWICMNCS